MLTTHATDDDVDDDGLRARTFKIQTRRKCQEQQIAIAGEFLLTIERNDGEVVSFVVANTARLLEWCRKLDPEAVYVVIGADEQTALPDLLFAEGVVALHWSSNRRAPCVDLCGR